MAGRCVLPFLFLELFSGARQQTLFGRLERARIELAAFRMKELFFERFVVAEAFEMNGPITPAAPPEPAAFAADLYFLIQAHDRLLSVEFVRYCIMSRGYFFVNNGACFYSFFSLYFE